MSSPRKPSVEELQLGRIYAEAVWNIAVARHATAALVEEFKALITEVLDVDPRIAHFFGIGSISRARRGALLTAAFGGRVSELTLDFLQVLNRNGRLQLVRAVALCLQELWEKSQGKVAVQVRTATPLADDQQTALKAMIAQRFGIDPELKLKTDASLLGGVWLRIGDTVYDRTVRKDLKNLREKILARSTHEIQSG